MNYGFYIGQGVVLFVILIFILRTKARIRQLENKPGPKDPKNVFNGANVEHTTGLPISFAAQTCTHMWDEVKNERLEGELETKLVIIMACRACGTIDKTIEQITKKCKHRWDERTHTTESPFEIRYSSAASRSQAPEPDNENAWMFKKKKVVIRTCVNCGETKQTDLKNVDDKVTEDSAE